MKLSISLSIALIVLILDLASKYWVESALEFGQSIALTSFFNLVPVSYTHLTLPTNREV